ncbi:MAG: hypothetical protein Fur0043_22330 [Anaerolineales bacterium]
MIPLHLHLSGFLSYRDAVEVDFTPLHLACIAGPNGAGKSSLLDALTWALFGQARGRSDQVIHLHPEVQAAQVALTFAYEGNLYRVIRRLPRGKSALLEFQIAEGGEKSVEQGAALQASSWRPLTERTLRETQARIESTLRLDYETFVNASFFLQGRADQFSQQNASRRKEVLGSILGLEIWEIYRERTVARRKEIEKEIAALERSMAEIASELAEEETRKRRLRELEADLKQLAETRRAQERALEDLRQALARLDRDLAAEKARLEEERRGLKEQESAISQQSSVARSLMTKMEAAKQALADAEARMAARNALEERIKAAREELAALKAENDLRKLEMDELKARIDQLSAAQGATCPLCGQALSEAHRLSTLQRLQSEGRQQGDRYRANKARMDELTRQIAGAEMQVQQAANAEKQRLSLSNAIAQWTDQIEKAQQAAHEWEVSGAKRLQAVEELLASQKFATEIQPPAGNLAEAERALLQWQERENAKNQEVGAARQRVEVLDTLRARQQALAAEREEKLRLAARHKTLERAFGKDGAPALLIEQVLPQIEMRANDLLDRLSGGTMSIRFATQTPYKDKKRDDLKETLDILISDGAGLRDYEMYSGGERFRVDFAIRLALSEVLAQRKGARLQTLVIDEGFGSQDAQGRQRLVEAINLVKDDFAKILVITHLDELKDAFPHRIEVEKADRGSRVRVV